MAQKTDVQYIRFYTDGSAARQLEPELPQKKKEAFRPIRRTRAVPVIHVDVLALTAIAVAAVMFVLMAVGVGQVRQAQAQAARMAARVEELRLENGRLAAEYEAGYDLGEIESQARQLGLIPQSEAERITITVELPQPVRELTLWERVQAFFADLFA